MIHVRLPSTNEQRLNVDSRSQQLYVPGAVQLYAVDAVSVTAESCSLKPGACRYGSEVQATPTGYSCRVSCVEPPVRCCLYGL